MTAREAKHLANAYKEPSNIGEILTYVNKMASLGHSRASIVVPIKSRKITSICKVLQEEGYAAFLSPFDTKKETLEIEW